MENHDSPLPLSDNGASGLTRVLIIITKSNWGGAQRYVYDLATGLPRERYDTLVAFGKNGPLGERLRDAGIRTHSLPELSRDVSLRSDISSFISLLRILAVNRPNVLHLNSSKIGALGALAGRIHNIREWLHRKSCPPTYAKIIFTGHGWAFNEERPQRQKILIRMLHWITVLLTHQTIAVSRTTRDDIVGLPFLKQKLSVIPNGIDGSPELLSRAEALERLNIPKDWRNELSDESHPERPLLVGTIAELHRNKGIQFAISAISELPKFTEREIYYAVIASGDEEARLQDQIITLSLEDRVTLLGYRKNAAELLPAFDIFLLPSITEAMPYVILEAGASGLPIIATAVGGIPEVIEDMKTGILLQPRNPTEIARAIAYLALDDERRHLLADRAHARISERFTLTEMIEKTTAVYDSPVFVH